MSTPRRAGTVQPSLLMVATLPLMVRTFLCPFARYLQGLGWRVDAMARDISHCTVSTRVFDHVWDVEWARNPLHLRHLLSAPHQIRRVVASGQYDVVHVHTPVAGFITRYALRHLRATTGVSVIYTAHGFHFHPGGSPVMNAGFLAMERLAGRWTDYLVTINREDEIAAKQYRLVPSERVWYTPGIGVDRQIYRPDVVDEQDIAEVRRELALPADAKLFLMIGEFNPGKRQRDAVGALAHLDHPDVYLALAGVGPQLEEIKRLTERLAIRDHVHFLGFRRDIPALIRASVATLLPSQREGLARCVMESLCMGVPVIGSQVRGVAELLATGGGLAVSVGDVPGIARAMAWVLDHPAEAQAMGRRGCTAMAAYDLQHVVSLHEALYSEALRERRRRQGCV